MPKYASAQVPEKERAARKQVFIKNGSHLTLEFLFDASDGLGPQLWSFPPMTQKMVDAEVAWYALGDPDLRPGMQNKPLAGDTHTWMVECTRLQEQYGAKVWDPTASNGPMQAPGRMVYDKSGVWEAIRNGLIRCPEFGTRAHGYYNGGQGLQKPVHLATDSLVEDDDERQRQAQASRRLVATDPLEDDDDVVAPPRKADPVGVGSF